ncbi:MAG: DNA gyrase subunit A [Nanoarchaeota archaeon]
MKKISEFIQEEYKSYSKYVLEHRAIPSVIDGFKMVQRKAFFLLKGQKSFMKVASVGGELISKAGYNHGDASANSAVSLMAQDFPGGNNISLLEGKGSFGSRFIQEPAAARYIYVKASGIIPYLYKDLDLCPEDPDPEHPEAKYYLAVGYFSQNKYQHAKEILNNLIKKYPDSKITPKAHYLYAKSFFNQKKYNQALNIFN